MIWKKFLAILDDARASIRANRSATAVIVKDDPILRDLYHLLEEAGQAKRPTKLIEVEVDDVGNPVFPASAAKEEAPKATEEIAEVILVEGAVVKKTITPRENKPIPIAPIVEEATEETVGKD